MIIGEYEKRVVELPGFHDLEDYKMKNPPNLLITDRGVTMQVPASEVDNIREEV